jgi:N-acetylmuramoyl-L-alanine amidase
MPWYPDAIKKPVTRFNPGGDKATLRTKGRGVCYHVAVSLSASLFNYFNTPGNPCSHFYVRFDGTVEQYVDTDYRAPANLQGNPTLLSIETMGGKTNVDTEPWTPDQLTSLIKLTQWLQFLDRFPIQLMPNSISSSKGLGWHKLGVNPWRVDSGELWSESYGKVCPGAKKIEQINTVILPGVKGEIVDMATLESIETKLDGLIAAEAARYGVYTGRYNVETDRWESEVDRDAAEANLWVAEIQRDKEADTKLDQILANTNPEQLAAKVVEQLVQNFPEIDGVMVKGIVVDVINSSKLQVVNP